MWYCLFLTIFQNKIQAFPFSFELNTFGSERVNISFIIQDVTNSTITAEQPAETTNSDATDCDDVDDNVLSDEALDQLDKELEAESSVEKELDVTSTCTVVNGTGDPEKHAVVSYYE